MSAMATSSSADSGSNDTASTTPPANGSGIAAGASAAPTGTTAPVQAPEPVSVPERDYQPYPDITDLWVLLRELVRIANFPEGQEALDAYKLLAKYETTPPWTSPK